MPRNSRRPPMPNKNKPRGVTTTRAEFQWNYMFPMPNHYNQYPQTTRDLIEKLVSQEQQHRQKIESDRVGLEKAEYASNVKIAEQINDREYNLRIWRLLALTLIVLATLGFGAFLIYKDKDVGGWAFIVLAASSMFWGKKFIPEKQSGAPLK